jgi:hypothetical protein
MWQETLQLAIDEKYRAGYPLLPMALINYPS